ncbi:hypothetical protein BDZ88DRAFT_412751 [Geranomyces variabilis]|nr:hypothetical protein BDZ88DRAFT_412751 [Geranomyces variabilis]KAJ3133069.1 hypothetical protein HDU90_006411 [Geranomyces variabilis]
MIPQADRGCSDSVSSLDRGATNLHACLGEEAVGLYLLQSVIIAVCVTVLALGIPGSVQVSEARFPLTESSVAFAIGVAVQVALIAAMELSRRICQMWFWARLTSRGQSLRSIMTTWSVIYSNSYRGAEDIFKGIGPISGFLMLMYFMEVVVLGAIGSLYRTENVVTLKGAGSLPMYRPIQSDAVLSENAFNSTMRGSLAFFNFAKLYDPTSTQGTETGGTCAPLFQPRASGAVLACASVLTHPLTVPLLAAEGEATAPVVPWTTLEKGDLFNSRATEIFTSVSCEPSDGFSIDQPVTGQEAIFLFYTSPEGVVTQSTKPLWAVSFSLFTTPQVQVITLGGGSTGENPLIDENGAMIFAMLAFNFDDYPGWSELTMNTLKDYSHAGPPRQVGLALCRATVGLGTTKANYSILQSDPSLVVKLNSAVRDPGQPINYSMDPAVNVWGYSLAIFLLVSTFMFGCDAVACSIASPDPPYFDLTIGLVKVTRLTNGTVAYTADLQTAAQGMSRLLARIIPSFTSAVNNATGMDSNLVTTSAAVWELTSTLRIYTTPACNIILGIGIGSAVALMLLQFGPATRVDKPSIGITSSIYVLLQALLSSSGGKRILADIARRDAGLARLKKVAEGVMVKSTIDPKGQLWLEMTMDRDGGLEEPAVGNRMVSGKYDVEAVGLGDGTALIEDDEAI